jgi:hypothetical protein
MFGSKAVSRLHVVLLAVFIVVAIVAVIVLVKQPSDNRQPLPTRESAIPLGAVKSTKLRVKGCPVCQKAVKKG